MSIRHKTLAYLPHFSGALSVFGSTYIIVDVLRKKSRRRDETYDRLLLGLSVTDVLASLALFLSTWPIPHEGPSHEYMSLGSIATCNAQGFFVQLGVATPVYNACLAIFYLLVVKYGWRPEQFARSHVERYMHAIPWILGISTAVASLCLNQYNSANLWCWIAPMPMDCLDSARNGGVSTCIRGDNAWLYRLFFYFIWLWLSVLIVMGATAGVLYKVVSQVRRIERLDKGRTSVFHSSAGITTTSFTTTPAPASPPSRTITQSSAHRHIRTVAHQSILYVGAFILTALFPSLVRMFQAKFNCTTTYFPLSVMTATFFPLQGFWNFLIYTRPTMKRFLDKHRGRWRVVPSSILRPSFLRKSAGYNDTASSGSSTPMKNLPGDIQKTIPTTTEASSSPPPPAAVSSPSGTSIHDTATTNDAGGDSHERIDLQTTTTVALVVDPTTAGPLQESECPMNI